MLLEKNELLSLLENHDASIFCYVTCDKYDVFLREIEAVNLLKEYFSSCKIEQFADNKFCITLNGFVAKGIRR